MSIRKILLSVILTVLGHNLVMAEEFIVVALDTYFFEEPNIKGYKARNMKDDEIMASTGMVFPKTVDGQKVKGWHTVTYSPGLRAYITGSAVSDMSRLSLPSPGKYTASNNPARTVDISKNNDNWLLSHGSSKLNGISDGYAIVFLDETGKIAFSLVTIDGKTILMDYDNEVTGFF